MGKGVNIKNYHVRTPTLVRKLRVEQKQTYLSPRGVGIGWGMEQKLMKGLSGPATKNKELFCDFPYFCIKH